MADRLTYAHEKCVRCGYPCKCSGMEPLDGSAQIRIWDTQNAEHGVERVAGLLCSSCAQNFIATCKHPMTGIGDTLPPSTLPEVRTCMSREASDIEY